MTEPSHHREPSWADWVIVSIFLTMMVLPVAVTLAHREPAASEQENRNLSRLPTVAWSAKSINDFPASFEAYYNDHFGLRNQFIRWHHLWKLRVLNVSPSPAVVLGQQGWMFDKETVDYLRARPLTFEELEKWRAYFEEKERFVAAEGVKFILVIPPSTSTVYPEYLPRWSTGSLHGTRLDQVLRHMETHSRIRILDLRPALIEAKTTARLYQRTDTHWNDRGAYIGYREIIESIARDLPEVGRPAPLSEFEARTQIAAAGDVARLTGLADLFGEERLELVPRMPRHSKITEWFPEGARFPATFCMKIEGSSKPRAIVFHDSFTHASLFPFLAEHFSEVWFHWSHYFDAGLTVPVFSHARGEFRWQPGMMTQRPGRPKADIVILEIAERLLSYDPMPTWEQIKGK
jgi:alginate O-acetyltransferase complex protein AlgJ